ncbi:MAG: hypothetical protein MEQ07_07090 [Aquimonas sp.]|nr:hypothetical protein [Aquimonas sp.]
MNWLPWALYALALFCFGYAFVAHSVPLAFVAMLTALGSIIWGTLLLAQARIADRSQSSMTLLGPEELAALRARAQAQAASAKQEAEQTPTAPAHQTEGDAPR